MNQTQLSEAPSCGHLLRQWRQRRGLSQLDLSLSSDISQRHISFVESGRSRPSAELLLQLSQVLEIPLRDQNVLLTAAGFSPLYAESDLSAPELAVVQRAIQFMLKQHEPYPALVMDRYWTLIDHNQAAGYFLEKVIGTENIPPSALIEGRLNLILLFLNSPALQNQIGNWPEVATAMSSRLHHEASQDIPGLSSTLAAQIRQQWPNKPISRLGTSPVIETQILYQGQMLSFFTLISTLGTPNDITLQEIRLESFFPADAETERVLREWSEEQGQ